MDRPTLIKNVNQTINRTLISTKKQNDIKNVYRRHELDWEFWEGFPEEVTIEIKSDK